MKLLPIIYYLLLCSLTVAVSLKIINEYLFKKEIFLKIATIFVTISVLCILILIFGSLYK